MISPPFVRKIDPLPSSQAIFDVLAELPRRLWLDSASDARLDVAPVVRNLSRFSFLTADPIHVLETDADERPGDQANPWDELANLVSALPIGARDDLPPFQGGMAGYIGYEAAHWLEPVALADCDHKQVNDLPTPAMSLGLYDWVIAIDHFADEGWLICQDFREIRHAASKRAFPPLDRVDQITQLLATAHPHPSLSCQERGRDDWRDDFDRLSGEFSLVSNFTSTQYQAAVAEIIERIRSGDSFQVNLAQRLSTTAKSEADVLYKRLRRTNPAPFGGFYDGGDYQVLSSSPEGFLQLRDRVVETRPIKGTIPRTGDLDTDERFAEKLLASEKDRAENIMIVDLMRNDLSKVCEDESVIVKRLCEIERFQYVQHLVSVVRGTLRQDANVVDLLRACFPGGSVTGAPKIEAMRTIAELESHPRGPYCGSMGYISCTGDADFNILIRTITAAAGRWQIPVGGGITAQSDPAAEEAETWAKAKGMLKATTPSREPESDSSAAPL